MYVLRAQSAGDALYQGIRLLQVMGEPVAPRGLATLEASAPVATVYPNPLRRVVFCPIRDANPFFHLFEALWILAGREDVAFVKQFNAKIAQYSDDEVKFHGAYGHRLRFFGATRPGAITFKDQLATAIELLKRDHDTRQVVLQIWEADRDLGTKTKDLPCNDLIFLKIRHEQLHMRVCCRSNDIIWGAYGANVVQFSVMLEYLAQMVGVGIGSYTQISDSYHGYVDNPQWKALCEHYARQRPVDYYDHCRPTVPLVDYPETFDRELDRVLNDLGGECDAMRADVGSAYPYKNNFFAKVVFPMYDAWKAHKLNKTGYKEMYACQADDWRMAGKEWLARRADGPMSTTS